jgi:hypothetical protein
MRTHRVFASLNVGLSIAMAALLFAACGGERVRVASRTSPRVAEGRIALLSTAIGDEPTWSPVRGRAE